ncbi:MAG: amidohydrolase family protein [Pseudomonadota bacterium]
MRPPSSLSPRVRATIGFGLLMFSLHAQAKDWVVTGTIVTADQVLADGALSISGDKFAAVGERAALPKNATVTRLDGIVLPGFIDLHNHLTWNVHPRWVPNRKFSNRYEWQNTAEYDRVLAGPHAALGSAICEAEIFGEVKALIGGATSVVGSLTPDKLNCSRGLLRNLDVNSGLNLAPPASAACQKNAQAPQPLFDLVVNDVFPLEIDYERMNFLRCALGSGALRSLVVHLSEGADASARREFRMLNKTGLLMPGLVVVHGTALRAEDFQVMGEKKAGLVWSPRSNDELYGDSTNIAAALQQNVSVAIAPDWSPTGSAGMLQEIGYAGRRYKNVTPAQLIAMGTSVPAKIARLDDRIGALAPGLMADFIVLRGDKAKPHLAAVLATPADVQLVVVGGQPMYGDASVMAELLPGVKLETLTVCGARKSLYLADSAAASPQRSFADIQANLTAVLAKAGAGLAGFECN